MAVRVDLEAINKLLGGLYPGEVLNIFGPYLSGKTLLTTQLSYYLMQEFGKAVLIDIDGGGRIFVNSWDPIFRKRYPKAGEMKVVTAFNKKHQAQKKLKIDLTIFELFGVKAYVELSEGGKGQFTAYGICDSLVEKLAKEGYKVFIIDSFSQIFKDSFPGVQSFGERARAEDMLFSLVKMFLQDNPDSFFFLNHHVSVNPMTQHMEPAGGSAVVQNSKLGIMIAKRIKEDRGRIFVYRHPTKPPWSEYADIVYTEAGIFDAERVE